MDSTHIFDKDEDDIKMNDFITHSDDLIHLLDDYDQYLTKYSESILPRLALQGDLRNIFGGRGQRGRTLGRIVVGLPDSTFALISSNFGQLCKFDIQLGMLESFQRLASAFFCVHRGSPDDLQRYYYSLKGCVKTNNGNSNISNINGDDDESRLHTLFNFLTASGIVKTNTIREMSIVSFFLEFFDCLDFDDFLQSLMFFASFDDGSDTKGFSAFTSCVVPLLFLIGFDLNVIPLIRSTFGPISQSLLPNSTILVMQQQQQQGVSVNSNSGFSSPPPLDRCNQGLYTGNDLLSPPLLQHQQQSPQQMHQQQQQSGHLPPISPTSMFSTNPGRNNQDIYTGSDLLSPPLHQQQSTSSSAAQQQQQSQYGENGWDASLFGQNDDSDISNNNNSGSSIDAPFIYQQSCAYQTASSPQSSLIRPNSGLMQQQQQQQLSPQQQINGIDMNNVGATGPFTIGNDGSGYDNAVTIEDNSFESPSSAGPITATPGTIVVDDYYGVNSFDNTNIEYGKHHRGGHHHHHHKYVSVKTEKVDDYPTHNIMQQQQQQEMSNTSSSSSYGYPLYYSTDTTKPQQIYYPDNAKLASSPSLTKPQVLTSLPQMAGQSQSSLEYSQYFPSISPASITTSSLSTSAPSASSTAAMLAMQQHKMNAVSSPPAATAAVASSVTQAPSVLTSHAALVQSKSTTNLPGKGRSKYSTKAHRSGSNSNNTQQSGMLGVTQPPPPPIPLQSLPIAAVPVKSESYENLSSSTSSVTANSLNLNLNLNRSNSSSSITVSNSSGSIASNNISQVNVSNNSNNSSTINNDADVNGLGKVCLHISKQPPAKTVYQRILKPYPTVMVCGLENTGLANLFVEAILLRADNEIDARSCMEGTVVVKVSNSFAVFKKLKILTTSQQQGTLFKLRFILKSYCGSDFRAIPNTEATSNTIEVFSHTLYLNHDRSQSIGGNGGTTGAMPVPSQQSPLSSSGSQQLATSPQSMTGLPGMGSNPIPLPSVMSPTSSILSSPTMSLNPMLQNHGQQQQLSSNQNQNQGQNSGFYSGNGGSLPVVKMVIPQCCRAGERVVVIGNNFCDSANIKVSFNDVSVVPSYHESGTLICTVPRLAFKSSDVIAQNEMQVSVRVSNDSITFSDSVFTIIYYNDQ